LNCKKKLEKKIKLTNESQIKKLKLKEWGLIFFKKIKIIDLRMKSKNKLKSNKKAKNQNH
jgi:hypothetical protein